MALPFAKGKYQVQNPEKYVGNKQPTYRSSWELTLMRKFDMHPGVLKWASENVAIPYLNPITGRMANYWPDFMIQYQDKDGRQHVELLEVKPSTQTTLEGAKSGVDRAMVHQNAAKWAAASEWCARKGIQFRILNEGDIYHTVPKRKVVRRKRRRV